MKTYQAVILVIVLVGCGEQGTTTTTDKDQAAIHAVAAHLGAKKLGVTQADRHAKSNPKGDGTFVYVPKTRFKGVERNVIWIVIDDHVYPLNGATKGCVTADLHWPREAPENLWARTGLSLHSAKDAIELVFDIE